MGYRKYKSRDLMYWPIVTIFLHSDAEKLVSQCEIHEKFQKPNSKELLKPNVVPHKLFEKIG